jgi:hypothetical protein
MKKDDEIRGNKHEVKFKKSQEYIGNTKLAPEREDLSTAQSTIAHTRPQAHHNIHTTPQTCITLPPVAED